MTRVKEFLIHMMPIIGLLILVIAFAILTDGKSISKINLKILTNQIVVVGLVATGAVFTFSSGAIDMSMSGTMALSAIFGSLVGQSTESFPAMIVVTIITAMSLSMIKGLAAAYMTLPVFIVTLIFGTVLSAIGLVALGDETSLFLGSMIPDYEPVFLNTVFLFGFFLFALIIFNYTKIGKSLKLMGGNILAAGQSGISQKKYTIIAFLLSGVGVTLATIMTMMKTKTVMATTGSSVGFDLLIAVVIGGMPLTGGPRSKISAGIIGAATITVMNNGLSIMNVDNDVIQIIRGIIFLTVVFMTSMSYRTKLLPK